MVLVFSSSSVHNITKTCIMHNRFIWIKTCFTSPLYFDHNKFYIATFFNHNMKSYLIILITIFCYITMFIAVLHHYFILTRTSFTSPLYFDHNKFHITTLFGPQKVLHRHFFSSQQVLPHFFINNKYYITMFIASVDADGDLVFSPSLHCKASDAQKLIFTGCQCGLIFITHMLHHSDIFVFITPIFHSSSVYL